MRTAKRSTRALPKDGAPKKKIRKIRKPLTPEQKAERVERLAKARAAKGPSEHKSVHSSVSRDDKDPVNVTTVRKWIRSNQERLAAAKASLKLNEKNRELNNEVNILDTYVHNMQSYLRTGVWLDHRWGENMEGRINSIVRVNAYHWHPADPFIGMVKRQVGTWYQDIGLWTQEMHEEYYGIPEFDDVKPKTKTKVKRKTKARKKPK